MTSKQGRSSVQSAAMQASIRPSFVAGLKINRMTIQIALFLLFLLSNGAHSSQSSSSIKQSRRQVRQLSTSKCVCGVENNYSARLQRIVAGTEIKPELRFPWILPLVYRNGSFFCAGTLINSRYVLTSAHCFRYSKQDALGELRYMISSDAVIVPERITSNMLVGLGVHNLQNDDHQPPAMGNSADSDRIQPTWLSIDYAIIHRFYENYENAILHDIALIRLRKELDFERFRWLRPICLPDPEQFELEPFNKFQLEQYIQPNVIELNNPPTIDQLIANVVNRPPSSGPSGTFGRPNIGILGGPVSEMPGGSGSGMLGGSVNVMPGESMSGMPSGPMNGVSTGTVMSFQDLIKRFNVIAGMSSQMQAAGHSPMVHPINNQLANQLASLMQDHPVLRNGSYSNSLYSWKEPIDAFLAGNETLKSLERINSKRMKLADGYPGYREIRKRSARREPFRSEDRLIKLDDGKFYAAGWGSTERNVWKLSKVPLWMQLKMLTRDQCIEKNGERVKWNFICAEGLQKEQETTVGDSGGPLFGEVARKGPTSGKLQSMKNKPPVSSSTQPPSIKKPVQSNVQQSTSTLKPTSSSTTTTTTTTPATTTTTTTTQRTTTTERTTTEKQVVKYITKPPLKFKLLSKRPQVQQAQQAEQHTNNEMNALLTKVKENTNRHFYSSMIYEDLFKSHNLPRDDLRREAVESREEEEEKESRDLIDNEEDLVENEDKPPKPTGSNSPADTSTSEPPTSPLTDELDLSRNNYVQLGITSWSSYLNPEIGMYTDVRAYLSWIKRNTPDAHYCITDPAKQSDDKVPLPTPRPDTPDGNLNLDCGAEKLHKITYPWLVSLYANGNKFLGNCVYFYSNFVMCSDIYAEQTQPDITQQASRFSVEFYYPSRRFKVKNIVNRLLGSSNAVNRREYIVLQLDDPDGQLPRHEPPGRKYNRANIDTQINKKNPQAACISTKDYPMNEESSSLVTFYLYAPGENLIRTPLKLTAYRKCKQLAPNFVTRRLLCAQIGAGEEVGVSEHFSFKKQDYPIPSLMEAPSSPTSSSTSTSSASNTTSFAEKLRNFFRIQGSGLFHHYSSLFKEYPIYDLSRSENDLQDSNSTMIPKSSRALDETFKELLDGQPVFHRIDNQYTLVGFLVKAPFPASLAFKHNNLIMMLDLKKFRFQVVTKLIKLIRTGRA